MTEYCRYTFSSKLITSRYDRPSQLMVEEADASHAHCHAVLITGGGNVPVLNAASSLRHIGHAKLGGVVNRIAEGEKGITANANTS
jgi:hypothetical protein